MIESWQEFIWNLYLRYLFLLTSVTMLIHHLAKLYIIYQTVYNKYTASHFNLGLSHNLNQNNQNNDDLILKRKDRKFFLIDITYSYMIMGKRLCDCHNSNTPTNNLTSTVVNFETRLTLHTTKFINTTSSSYLLFFLLKKSLMRSWLINAHILLL